MTKKIEPTHGKDCDCCKTGMEAFLKNSERIIAEFGHTIIGTEHELPDGQMISMSYSVGLSDMGLPELITFGIPAETARFLLNTSAKKMKNGQLKTAVAMEEIANSPLFFMPVPKERTDGFLNVANSRAGRDLDAIQLIWPDAKGRFPWDDNFNEDHRKAQLLLSHSRFVRLEKPIPKTVGGDLVVADKSNSMAKEISNEAIASAKAKSKKSSPV